MLDGSSVSERLRGGEAQQARRLFLITGGAGFIGSHLAEALAARGDVVRVLDDLSHGRRENLPRSVEFIEGDIADPQAVRRAIQDVDGCFHLAAISSVIECHSRWLEAHRTNMTGTINVFDAARRARPGAPVPVIYASSAAVYGDQGEGPLGEDLAPRPISSCGADKVGCELHARIAFATHGVPNVGLRFFNVFGPRQNAAAPHAAVVPVFCERIAARRPVAVFGDGGQIRDFIYVRDAVAALIAAMDQGPCATELFNVCGGSGVSIAELARRIAQLCLAEPEIAFKPARQSEVRHSLGDPTRAREVLGFAARMDLETGLRLTLKSLGTVAAL